MYRFNDECISLSRMNLIDRLYKGVFFTFSLVGILKATEKDSVMDCDETWCKVKDARYLLGRIGVLYELEEQYIESLLSIEQIIGYRQSLRTKEIIGRIRSSKFNVLTAENPPLRDELMDKAVNYLHYF